MTRTAKVFMTNRSQAVRLPKEYQFDTDEVLIRKVGRCAMSTASGRPARAPASASSLYPAGC